MEEISCARKVPKSSDRDDQKRIEESLKLASTNDGLRTVPTFKNIHQIVESMRLEFRNFSSVLTSLAGELMLAGMGKPENFRFTPLLMDGPPGVGKTAFAQHLATTLKLPFVNLNAGGMQTSAQLTGSSSHWGNTHTGEIFNMLSMNEVATGVILLDEAEKISDRQDYPILPALLNLLEPETARFFRDESLGLVFDASRLIVLMTSNSIDNINNALLSRTQLFKIGEPEFEQKLHVARKTFEKLNTGLPRGKRLMLDEPALLDLARKNISTRRIIQGVRQAVIQALSQGDKTAKLFFSEEFDEEPRREIGFHARYRM